MSGISPVPDEFERGRKEGRIDALLEAHSEHLGIINGSIERSAKALEAVAETVRELGRKFDLQIGIAEAARVALAEETERRRRELADKSDERNTTWSKREKIITAIFSGLSAFSLLATLYLKTHGVL